MWSSAGSEIGIADLSGIVSVGNGLYADNIQGGIITYGGYFLHTLSPSTQGPEEKAWLFLSKPHSGRRQWKGGLLGHFFMSLKPWGPWHGHDHVNSMHAFTQELPHSWILPTPYI